MKYNQSMLNYYSNLIDSTSGEDLEKSSIRFVPFEKKIEGFSWLFMHRPGEAGQAYERYLPALKTAQELMYRLFFRSVDMDKISSVFDVGCGLGKDLLYLAHRYPHLKLYGYNVSEEQVEVASEIFTKSSLVDRVSVSLKNIVDDGIDNNCDLGICIQVLHHIRERSHAIKNMSSGLRGGGIILFSEIISNLSESIEHKSSSGYFATKQNWARSLADAGLLLIDAIDMSEGVKNYVSDTNFENNFNRVTQNLSEDARAHIRGPEGLSSLLERDLASYFYLSAIKMPELPVEFVYNKNLTMFSLSAQFASVVSGCQPCCVAQSRIDGDSVQQQALVLNGDVHSIEKVVKEEVSLILGIDVDHLKSDEVLIEMGMDSLLALDLKNTLEKKHGIRVSIAQLLGSKTLDLICTELLETVQ